MSPRDTRFLNRKDEAFEMTVFSGVSTWRCKMLFYEFAGCTQDRPRFYSSC